MRNLEWQLIVTDNCADWDVESTVKGLVPDAKIIKNALPKGFGANHNQALQNSKDAYALILNDDIELHGDAVVRLFEFAEKKSQGVLFGPILFSGSWNSKYISAGGSLNEFIPRPILSSLLLILRLLGASKFIHSCLERRNQTHRAANEQKGYISGACCLVRRSFIDQYALYDEGYYMYFEDVDLGHKARINGFECWQVAEAKVMHLEGSSFTEKTWSWIAASTLRYAKQHSNPVTIFMTQLLIAFSRVLIPIRGSLIGRVSGKC